MLLIFTFCPRLLTPASSFSSLVGAGSVSMQSPEVRGGAALARAGRADLTGGPAWSGVEHVSGTPASLLLPVSCPFSLSSCLPCCAQAQLHMQTQQSYMGCLLLKAGRDQPPYEFLTLSSWFRFSLSCTPSVGVQNPSQGPSE